MKKLFATAVAALMLTGLSFGAVVAPAAAAAPAAHAPVHAAMHMGHGPVVHHPAHWHMHKVCKTTTHHHHKVTVCHWVKGH